MSTTAGVFSETVLQNIRAMASARMMDERIKLNYVAQTDVAQIIPKVQTAKLGELQGAGTKKKYTVEIEWANNCAIVAEDCEYCAEGGPELSTNTTTVSIDHCVQAPFSVNGVSFIDNDFDTQDMIADGLLTADKVISEELCHRFLDWLVANAGIANWPPLEPAGIGTVVGNEVRITGANFTIAAVGYLQKVLQYDRIQWTNNISGNQLFNAYQNVGFTEGWIPEGIGTTKRVSTFPILFDLFNFSAAGYNDRIISLANGSIAFCSASYYTPQVTMVDSEQAVYTMSSRFFPGLVLEVWMKKTCDHDLTLYDFNVKGRYEFVQNPAGCDQNNNGIIQFVQFP